MMPTFQDEAAGREWTRYFAEVERLLADVGDDGAGLRQELETHLTDSYASGDPHVPEAARLRAAIVRLGRPGDYLRPLLADELIDRGTRSYHPAPIARGLYHSFRAGSSRAIIASSFGIGYLLLALFTAMALLKPVWGDHVGLFRHPNGTVSFGIVAATAGARELLGWWVIPIAVLVAAIVYVVLTKALRATHHR